MQLTIDSSEPIDHVLAVISAIYQAPIAAGVAPPAGSSLPEELAPEELAPTELAATKKKAATRTRKTGSTPARSVEPAAVRAWARAHGITVGGHGQIPEAVVPAYQTAP